MRVTKDRVPLRHSGAPAKKRRGTEAHLAGAVGLLCMRVASLRAGEDRAPKTGRWLRRTVTERCLDCSAALASPPASPSLRVFRKWKRRAKKHPGSLTASTIVSFARQVGYAQATGEDICKGCA